MVHITWYGYNYFTVPWNKCCFDMTGYFVKWRIFYLYFCVKFLCEENDMSFQTFYIHSLPCNLLWTFDSMSGFTKWILWIFEIHPQIYPLEAGKHTSIAIPLPSMVEWLNFSAKFIWEKLRCNWWLLSFMKLIPMQWSAKSPPFWFRASLAHAFKAWCPLLYQKIFTY